MSDDDKPLPKQPPKQPMQASGQEDGKGAGDGGLPDGGHEGAGESGGGAYPNPHTGQKPKDGFMGHGGQTELNEKPEDLP